ncbi:hypothetical protein EST38_g5408 [Candolleomyces aberdarensis]|uniref:Uncharacterized protein n=1 Tax=Candolleomyces aberdarensis TaxID=2316362 RepID=A0A4Q2DNA8_9AGAR|nr:hypothetical protein EST38_g5408 [Candolleomyces aberdarensis]
MLFANVIATISLLFSPYLTLAALVNRTIDDTTGDSVTGLLPVYFPSPSEVSMWKNHNCPRNDCVTRPDINKTFGRSYTAATFRSEQSSKISITLRFNGTAIYIFFTLTNIHEYGTDCQFVLDNVPVEPPYVYMPDRSKDDILYQQPVFDRTGLANTEHTLEIVTEGLARPSPISGLNPLLNSHDDTPPGNQTDSSSSKTPIGAIAGGAAGGTLFTVAAFFLFFCLRRRRRRRRLEKRPALVMDGLDQLQYRVDPLILEKPDYRGPPSSALESSSPIPQQSQDGLHENYSALLPSMPTSSDYSSSNPGITTRRYPLDLDQVPGATGSSSAGGTLFNPGANYASGVASTSTFPRQTRNLAASSPLVVLPMAHPEEQEQVQQDGPATIGDRLGTLEQEMNELRRGFSTQMREEIVEMQQEIQMLRENQGSDLAMRLTDEPPPGYVANPKAIPHPVSGQHS